MIEALVESSTSSPNRLQLDFNRVLTREQTAEYLGTKILGGTATMINVFSWYMSQDPIGETLMRASSLPETTASSFSFYNYYLTNSRIYEKGAKTYLRDSELTTTDHPKPNPDMERRLRNGELKRTELAGLIGAIDMRIDTGVLISTRDLGTHAGTTLKPEVERKLRDGELGLTELKHLLDGIDMLSGAGRDAELAILTLQPRSAQLTIDEQCEYLELVDRINMTNTVMDSLLEKIYVGIKNNPAIVDKNILQIGLRAFMKHMGNVGFDEGDSVATSESRRAYLLAAIEYLDDFILKRNLIDRFAVHDNRGQLLEPLWMLDAYFFLTMQGRYFAEVLPTLDNQDRPFADPSVPKNPSDLPQHNRAADIIVFDRLKGLSALVQTKAVDQRPNQRALLSPIKDTGYHASIYKASEYNFTGNDRNRLAAKLAAYSDAIDSGFYDEEKTKLALAYILPSVKIVFSDGFIDTEYNLFRKANKLKPDLAAVRRLKMLKPLANFSIPVEKLPRVVQEYLERVKGKPMITTDENGDPSLGLNFF